MLIAILMVYGVGRRAGHRAADQRGAERGAVRPPGRGLGREQHHPAARRGHGHRDHRRGADDHPGHVGHHAAQRQQGRAAVRQDGDRHGAGAERRCGRGCDAAGRASRVREDAGRPGGRERHQAVVCGRRAARGRGGEHLRAASARSARCSSPTPASAGRVWLCPQR